MSARNLASPARPGTWIRQRGDFTGRRRPFRLPSHSSN